MKRWNCVACSLSHNKNVNCKSGLQYQSLFSLEKGTLTSSIFVHFQLTKYGFFDLLGFSSGGRGQIPSHTHTRPLFLFFKAMFVQFEEKFLQIVNLRPSLVFFLLPTHLTFLAWGRSSVLYSQSKTYCEQTHEDHCSYAQRYGQEQLQGELCMRERQLYRFTDRGRLKHTKIMSDVCTLQKNRKYSSQA